MLNTEINQERIFVALEKADMYRKNNPITQQVLLMARYGDTELSSHGEIEQLTTLRQYQTISAKNEKLLVTFDKRIAKICKVQQKHNISGIVWEIVNVEQSSFSFPAMHHLLQPITSDIKLLKDFKPKVIEYAIQWAIDNELTLYRQVGALEEMISLRSPNDIWSFSACYLWAHLFVYADAIPGEKMMHLILGNGFTELNTTDCLWFDIH